MNKTMWTPGPWGLTSAGNGFRRPSERHDDQAIVGADGVCPGIVWMSDNGERDGLASQMRANARLIACAPTLYQVLELIEVDLTAGDMPARTRIALACSRIEAALKAARGE